jgi:carboxyl-terminal processing protease
MWWILSLSGLILLAVPVSADPVPGKGTPVASLGVRDADTFAAQLRDVSAFVSQSYARPVSRERLLRAALRGLYRTADRPMPPVILALLHQALKDERESNRGSTAPAVKDERDLNRLLSAVRLSLGDPDSLGNQKAIRAALSSMTGALDPFSGVLELQQQLDDVEGEHRGLGLELEEHQGVGPVIVKAVALGGPAQKAGLRPGDTITHINGQRVGDPAFQPNAALHAPQPRLTVKRSGQSGALHMMLKPELFYAETVLGVTRRADNSWDYFVDGENRIALIRLPGLNRSTPQELTHVLDSLRTAGMRGLILDLRWCPGGYLDPACQIANCFLAEYHFPVVMFPTPSSWFAILHDLMVDTHRRHISVVYRNRRTEPNVAQPFGGYFDFPMIALVNGETSGGAELIAAVLQDNHRARIAGQRTRGKGSVQTMIPLSGHDGGEYRGVGVPNTTVKLTTGYIIRPSGKGINRFPWSRPGDDWGVRPDPGLELRVSAGLSQRLKGWRQLQDLRPGGSDAGLPLDDPLADAQREAALQILRGLCQLEK